MSTKPIDEFLQDCTVWLEKIAAAKQREEAAYAAINNVQMEKKALRMLARGAGHVTHGLGGLASLPGRLMSRLGKKLVSWGSKPKVNTSLQNPLTQQVSAALKSGNPQPRLLRTADGRVVLSSPLKAPSAPAPKAPPAPAPKGQPAPNKPATTTQTKPADPAAPVDAPKGQAGASTQAGAGAETAAGAEAATAKPGMFGKILPYAFAGGAGFIGGRSTAPEPTYTSPAMEHNNMVYQQQQQAATPNIY